MILSVKIKGLDKLQRKLKHMANGAKELSNKKHISFGELFTPAFMRKCSSFSSFNELLEAGGFEINSKDDFKAIPDDVFDKHISSVTKYSSWDKMLESATEQYISKKLGF